MPNNIISRIFDDGEFGPPLSVRELAEKIAQYVAEESHSEEEEVTIVRRANDEGQDLTVIRDNIPSQPDYDIQVGDISIRELAETVNELRDQVQQLEDRIEILDRSRNLELE